MERAIGEKIRELREAQGITQRELGFRTGLDPMTISRIERGVRLPSIPSFFLISRALHREAGQLISELEHSGLQLEVEESVNAPYRKRGRKRS